MRKKSLFIAAVVIAAVVAVSCARIKSWQDTHTPPDDACVHCHSSIYKNWKISYRPYNEAAKKEDYEHVHSRPMSAEDVKMQKAHREGKAECAECHVVQKPQELLTISKIGIFLEETTYELCGRCHKNTFEEWKNSRYLREEISCLVCHADTRDKPVDDKDGYYHIVEGIEGFDPRTLKPTLMYERLKSAVEVNTEVYAAEGKVIGALLIVSNLGVGHNLPTDSINAALLIHVTLKDSRGTLVEEKEDVIGGWKKSSIPPGKDRYLEYKMTAPREGEYNVEVTLTHVDREREKGKPITVYQKNFKVLVK